MSCMEGSTLTIRLDPETRAALDQLARETGRTQSDLAREALVRLLAVERFRLLRRQVLSETEKQAGVLTDEDVLGVVS